MERPDLDTLACVNAECPRFRQAGRDHLVIRKVDGREAIRLLRCRTCGEAFSERRGTALFNTKVPEAKAIEVIDHLTDGCGVRSTSGLTKVCKATVARLVRVSGRHAERVHDQQVQGLTPTALEFDEQWGDVKKKQKRCAEFELAEAGDQWDHRAVTADSKWVVSFMVGKHPYDPTLALVHDAKERLRKDPLPALFTDAFTSYEPALLAVLGRRYPAQGKGRLSVIRWRQGLAYGQVKKGYKSGRVDHVEVRAVHGQARLEQVRYLLGDKQINTSGVERHKGTSRLRNQRQVRKTLAFSKAYRDHRWMSWLSVGLYHFCRAHRSLRIKQADRVIHRSPAMTAGLTDHIWTIREWLLTPLLGGRDNRSPPPVYACGSL